MIATSRQAIELIQRFEGFSAKPYTCPAGKLTVGYGHVILPAENYLMNGVDNIQATNLLMTDIGRIEKSLSTMVNVSLNQNQWDALISFIYNIGIAAFKNSTMLGLINQGENDKAARQFSRWVYSRGKRLYGLVQRREAEKELYCQDP